VPAICCAPFFGDVTLSFGEAPNRQIEAEFRSAGKMDAIERWALRE
jgi:hypothetical protein